MCATLVAALVVGVDVRAQDDAPPARPELVAPARIPLHRGARIGDTLERTVKQGDQVLRERTSIVGSGPDGTWIVERSGPAWPGVVLRIALDATGATLRAEAGPPGAARRSEVSIGREAEEDAERPQGLEDVRCPAGTFRCRKHVLERDEPFPIRNARWLIEEGPRAGLLVREESQAAGRVTRLELIAVEDVRVRIPSSASDPASGEEVPCVHATLQPSLDGVPSPAFQQWTSTRPLFFGETLVRLDNGLGVTEITAMGRDGKSAFPR